MNAFLMHKSRDFDLTEAPPFNAEALIQDLELSTLFEAMGGGDEFLLKVARGALLGGMQSDVETILYRQEVLRDCLENPSVVRSFYDLTVEAVEKERKDFWGIGIFGKFPSSILHRSQDVMRMFVAKLAGLRKLAEEHGPAFRSEGFLRLFAMLRSELTDDYLSEITACLETLKFRDGVWVSAGLGPGGRSVDYLLHVPGKRRWWSEIFEGRGASAFTLHVHPRDETGARALYDISNRGLNPAANALAQAVEHILGFFKMLRAELAFYVGALNLQERLRAKGAAACFAQPFAKAERRRAARDLYDICLALRSERPVVGNDLEADGREVVIVTGANQGGKSTFLRSVGLAQLMMQSGLFVPARAFAANICDAVFTHYKREEDAAMESGKFDEELGRMSEIVDHLTPASLVLLNESFAATNEREGSEIARQITLGLAEKHIQIFFVTHLFEFAHRLRTERGEKILFLRAERRETGERTFRLIEGEPLQTSYGADLYEAIFGTGTNPKERVISSA